MKLARAVRIAEDGEPCGRITNLIRDEIAVPDGSATARECRLPEGGKIPDVSGGFFRFFIAATDCQSSTSLGWFT